MSMPQPTQNRSPGMVISMEGYEAPISFQWNPSTYKRDKSANWAEHRPIGREQPILQYSIGEAEVISFDMDVSEPGSTGMDAKSYIESFYKLTRPTVGQNVKHPPKLKLILGDTIRMECVLVSVSTEYGPLFHPMTLGPQQSKITLTFKEIK